MINPLKYYKRCGKLEAEKEIYYSPPDHLGSSSWITYTDGETIQHLHYLPFGENFVDQRVSSYDGTRYTFSAKEKDLETGYSYFGARYYSSDLSIWLSVDPMSDKYPSMSAYMYCAGNPVKLVDPDGREVYIFGDQATVAFSSLQNNTSLELSINEEGKVSIIGGEATNRNDIKLAKAINSKKVRVEIYADKSNKENDNGGAYMGTCFNENNSAESCNHINMERLTKNEEEYEASTGSGVQHEITEGYKAGVIALRRKRNIMPATRVYAEWDEVIETTQSTTQLSPTTRKTVMQEKTEHKWGFVPQYPRDYNLYKRAHKWASPEPYKYKKNH